MFEEFEGGVVVGLARHAEESEGVRGRVRGEDAEELADEGAGAAIGVAFGDSTETVVGAELADRLEASVEGGGS